MIRAMNASHQPCPCGRPRPYADCCGRLHDGQPAPDAESLMRSRYSAFVLDKLDYLLATWHSSTRPAHLQANEAGLRWLGLEVKQQAQQDADHATVEFVARSKLGGRAHRLHEISRFVREGGRWYYLDGGVRRTRA
ncbi:MAG: SEC-C domain-containing protein [Paucibacter sp.]|nr:SEC-C domain-containing protein [Roseateles sp.]